MNRLLDIKKNSGKSKKIVLKSFMFVRDKSLKIKINQEIPEDGSIYHGQMKGA